LTDIKTSQAARIKEVVGHCLDEDYYNKAAYSTKMQDYIKSTLDKMYENSMLDTSGISLNEENKSTLVSYIEKALDNIENE
jgi:hypothetical protein